MVLSDRIAIMRDGVLQQYSTPDETYNAPVNTFVAGFIGSPRMNFLKGRLVPDNGQVFLESDSLRIATPGSAAEAVAAANREALTVGVRPEHLLLAPVAPGAAVAQVELTEPVGPVTYLDLRLGDRALRASVPGNSRYAAGHEVAISLAPEHIHFFDGESGIRISA